MCQAKRRRALLRSNSSRGSLTWAGKSVAAAEEIYRSLFNHDSFVSPMPLKTCCTPAFTIAARTAQGSCNPDGCADESDCRMFRSTERSSVELLHELHTSAGKQAPSSGSQRNSPTPHCPSSSLSDSCCSVSHGEPAPPEMPHCSTGCHDRNATTDWLSRKQKKQR